MKIEVKSLFSNHSSNKLYVIKKIHVQDGNVDIRYNAEWELNLWKKLFNDN